MSATFKKRKKKTLATLRSVSLKQSYFHREPSESTLIRRVSAKCFISASFCKCKGLKGETVLSATCRVTNQELLLHPKYNKASTSSFDKKSEFILSNHRRTVSRRNERPSLNLTVFFLRRKKRDLWSHPWIKKKEPKLPRVF